MRKYFLISILLAVMMIACSIFIDICYGCDSDETNIEYDCFCQEAEFSISSFQIKFPEYPPDFHLSHKKVLFPQNFIKSIFRPPR